MPDTQWGRYEVFLQTEAGQPHVNVGSVHAPDGEMALMMARDVFVRRPPCVSLWVAPADDILSRTAQELEHATWPEEEGEPAEQTEFFYVFQKQKETGSASFVGGVEAVSPSQALRRALTVFAPHRALVWWVFPAGSLTSSAPGDVESMFDPAADKSFRDQADYHTVARMRGIRKGRGDAEPETGRHGELGIRESGIGGAEA